MSNFAKKSSIWAYFSKKKTKSDKKAPFFLKKGQKSARKEVFLLEEIADMLILQLLFCCWLSLSLIKELYLLQFLSFKIKKALSLAVPLYFSGLLFYSQSPLISFFVFLPCFLILTAFFLLKKQSERNLLLELYSLLNPLEFRMKSGDSFLSAWEKIGSGARQKAYPKQDSVFYRGF